MRKVVHDIEVYNSAYGTFKVDELPQDLIRRIKAGTSVRVNKPTPCPTCGHAPDPISLEEYTLDAQDAFDELEGHCRKIWEKKNEAIVYSRRKT